MYLKSLKLVGFKSFADRTRLEFEPGISVVVGPNGSGKSNIVDAVAWVLGTQSTRALRTETMEDVIFAGTATRPALGRAEVTLVFDNADHQLPLDLDEVSITRRLYRDGTSEYEINGVECRLLDIQELLSDSGLGRQQHVIVGQGQIDLILNAKGDQNRQAIEEAAGILKHRLRKDRAIRRLERTDIDVLRLHDITRELKRQMRPLRRQAKAAGRYDSVRDDLRALRLWLGGEELRRLRARSQEASAERLSFDHILSDGQSELDELERGLATLTEEAGQAGRDLDRDTAAAARLETTAERLQRIAQVAHERRRAMSSQIEGVGERRRDLEEETDRLTIDLRQADAREQQAQQEAELRETTLRVIEDDARSVAEQEAMPAEGAVAMARGDLRSLEGAAQRDEREADDVGRRLEVVEARRAQESEEIERLKEQIRSTDELTAVAQQVYENKTIARTAVQSDWEQTEFLVRSTEIARIGAAAKVEALQAAASGMANPQAREAAETAQQVIGALATIIDVPHDLAAAVDAAVAGWADALVVDDAIGLVAVVSALKSDGLGGIPLVVSGAELDELPARAAADRWGVETVVDRLGPNADRALAATLLGDVVLVEGWSGGWDIVQQEPGIRAVTPEGDLITAYGMSLVDPAGATPAVIEAARHSLEASEVDEARARNVEVTNRNAFEGAREQERAALEDLEALEAMLAGTADALDRLQRSQGAIDDELLRLTNRGTVLAQATEQREGQVGELHIRLSALEGEEAQRQELWEALARQRQELAARQNDARRAREEAAEALGGVVERRRMLETRLVTVTTELGNLVERPGNPAELLQLEVIEQVAKHTLDIVRDKVATLRTRQAVLREMAGEAGRRLSEARARGSELRGAIEKAKETLSGLAVEATELRMREEAVAEGLRREADAAEDEALAAPQPDLDPTVDPVARAESLAVELTRMGPINPLAAEEYRDLDERFTHINDQLSDLETSRGELGKVIKALDVEIGELFMGAFTEAARHYEQFFTILFPGGKGELRLTDPTKPLESGLEIAAQPMGKKVSRMSLLSGGERSLAALAFLFAVFKARPSPFYILDEVEAALDDTNLRRFLRLVTDFRGSAQLIVVTHQQATMEAADVLYGVTLEPGGSSKALTKRMDEVRLEV